MRHLSENLLAARWEVQTFRFGAWATYGRERSREMAVSVAGETAARAGVQARVWDRVLDRVVWPAV